MLLFSFLDVAHFYPSMTAWITSNLILQGNMGRMGCPMCLLVWPVPGEKQKHAQSWCLMEKRSRDKVALTQSFDPQLHWATSLAGCLPFLSFTQVCPLPPSFKTSCSLLVSLSMSFCQCWPGPGGTAWTPSPLRQEKRDTKCRLVWRQQYGLTPSFGCCDVKCKCVTGVHNFVWERREGLNLAIAVVLVWLQMVLMTLSSLHNCGQTDLTGFLPNSAWENHKTIK